MAEHEVVAVQANGSCLVSELVQLEYEKCYRLAWTGFPGDT